MDSQNKRLFSNPRVDQAAYNFTESEAATTYAGSMAETSHDDQTNVSTYSYRSNVDAARFLKEAHGRVGAYLGSKYS